MLQYIPGYTAHGNLSPGPQFHRVFFVARAVGVFFPRDLKCLTMAETMARRRTIFHETNRRSSAGGATVGDHADHAVRFLYDELLLGGQMGTFHPQVGEVYVS